MRGCGSPPGGGGRCTRSSTASPWSSRCATWRSRRAGERKAAEGGDMELEGQAAAITGGAGDLGRAIARLILRHGARVALIDRSEEALGRARADLAGGDGEPAPAGRLETVAADLTREREVERALEDAER